VPAWRELGSEPLTWFYNPNIQPAAEKERRLDSMGRYARAAGLELVIESRPSQEGEWREWLAVLGASTSDSRCAACLGLRLGAAAAAAAERGIPRFSTTLSVSPHQRHDLIRDAGDRAAAAHGVNFFYLDLRGRFRDSYAESRRFGLYRQAYCGCIASKWEAWQARRARRATQ
jgi:epoxyqueuosine reductase